MSRFADIRAVPYLAAVGWSGLHLTETLQRWRFARICEMSCGPYWPAELVGQLRAAMDWQTPLALAGVPAVLAAVVWVWRRHGARLPRL